MASLFEISWEVCNKVGGIHTVLRSKLPFMQEQEYVLIGPLVESHEFQPREPEGMMKDVLDACRERGLRCAYGSWIAPTEPAVILVDPASLVPEKDRLKHEYWERFGIDSLEAGFDFDEPLCFATAAGMIVEEYCARADGQTVVHCHEWMAGFALLYLKMRSVKAGTVFTTHATMLGRTVMGNGHPLYEMLEEMQPEEWAGKLGVTAKHLTERAAAREAGVFTTVSDITGREAEHLLGRKPDVLLYNGFHTEKFPTFEETSVMHTRSRDVLRELAAYAFFPHYTFELEETLFFFTSGRYEFLNKGMDVLIEALGKLNGMLQDRTVVMIFWVIMGRKSPRLDLLESKNFYHHVKTYVEWQSRPLLKRILTDIVSGRQPGEDHTSDLIKRMHADIPPLKRTGDPPLLTHDIDRPEDDPVLQACRRHGLLNRKEDRVKVLLYPGYLDGSDGLLNMHYYDATVGAHLGLFPSSYEPWGYTPLESAVLGVPAITTDKAGFGQFVRDCCEAGSQGIFVIDRGEETVEKLAEKMHEYANLDQESRVRHAFAAKSLAARADWKNFIPRYREAHAKALERI